MSGILYPRLAREVARERIPALRDLSSEELLTRAELLLEGHTYAAIGGRQVTEEEISALLIEATGIARECGFPATRREADRISFDRRMAQFLHERMRISPHQAADEEIWTHLTLGPLAAFAAWRFPGLPDERVLGRPRNTFRRLWWRAETLGPLATDEQALREDETVQIMERGATTATPAVARALAAAFRRRLVANPEMKRMELMRDAMKRVNRLTPFISLEALGDEELATQLDEVFAEAAGAISGESVAPLPPRSIPAPDRAPDPAENGDFGHVPLAELSRWLVEVVVARGEAERDRLSTALAEEKGIAVEPRCLRLLDKLAWSARGLGQLELDEERGVWVPGTVAPADDARFGDWTYDALVARAREMLGEDPDPSERLLELVGGNGKPPRIVAGVVATALADARRRRGVG